jgi:heptosyltransferase-3
MRVRKQTKGGATTLKIDPSASFLTTYPAGSEAVKRVLIYRLGSLGDTLIALPALHMVARAFPAAERRMLTNFPVNVKAPPAAAILEGSGLVQGYLRYSVGTRSLKELLSLWWTLLRWRPDVLIYLGAARGVESARRDAAFFKLCGIRRQIGVPVTEAMQENLWMDSEQALEPEGARLARNIAALGDAELEAPESWDLRLTEAELARAAEALAGAGDRPVIAVSVGTKVQSKDWGRENWRALLGGLGALYPEYALVLNGAREESEASEFAADGWRAVNPGPVINICGKLTPRESAAAFGMAKLFVGHDSGPMHLAAAVQTPCVAIFAARNKPRVWFPYGRQHRVLYHRVECWGCGLETCVVERKRCLTSITVDEVAAAVRSSLE